MARNRDWSSTKAGAAMRGRYCTRLVAGMAQDDHPEDALLWERPEWLAEVEDWIRERVGELGAHVTGAIERAHLRWWSTVLRVPTSGGDLYFKAGARTQAFEPALVLELARARPALVPGVVAAEPERGWMLMRDGGRQLRELVR